MRICRQPCPDDLADQPGRYCHLPAGHRTAHRAMVGGKKGTAVRWPNPSPDSVPQRRTLDVLTDALRREEWRIVQVIAGDCIHPGLAARSEWGSVVLHRAGQRLVIVADDKGDIRDWHTVSDASAT